MKILVVGRGGREHAICKKVKGSPLVDTVYVAPGNAGMKDCAQCIPIEESNHEALIQFAKKEQIDLTIIGPEVPLLEGLADLFTQENLMIFGPSQAAAQIEGSKAFAKQMMKKYHIPTADYQVFTDFQLAKVYIEEKGAPIVIKADGLAAGKGVVVATTVAEALTAAQEMLLQSKFGSASSRIVVEEFLTGEEFSLMALVHGETIVPLEIAQDHKRAYNGDQGPNTGGMGAYSPVPLIDDDTINLSLETILKPIVRAMINEGKSFTGVLYAGLIQTSSGPKVIEFNARFGDPETQVILPRMESDLVEVIIQLLAGKQPNIKWSIDTVLGVVVAAKGYPGPYQKGVSLEGIEQFTDDVEILYAGTSTNESGQFISNGGRVFLANAKAPSLLEAQQKVYKELTKLKSDQLFYRTDIGNKAIEKVVHI